MFELIDNGWKLEQINGSSGVWVASRGTSNIVYVENIFDEFERRSENFRNRFDAVNMAKEIVTEFATL